MKKKILTIPLIAGIFSIFIFRTIHFYKSGNLIEAEIDTKDSVKVRHLAEKAQYVKRSSRVATTGRIVADTNIDISPDEFGKIQKVLVKKYSHVDKNQKLVRIDEIPDGAMNSKSAESDDVPNVKTDLDENYISGKFRNSKKIEIKSLTQRFLIAPCSGYIRDIYQFSGANISPATKVLSIACEDDIHIKTSISPSVGKKISAGLSASIRSDEDVIRGRVEGVSKFLNEEGGVDVKITTSKRDMAKFLIDEVVEIEIFTQMKNFVRVPLYAIYANDSVNVVYVVDQKHKMANAVKIDTDECDDEYCYTNCINKDDVILTSALNFVTPKSKIEYEISQ